MNPVAMATPEVPEGKAAARPGRDRLALDPEAAFAAAAVSRDPGERLLAQTLQSLGWFAECALAIAFTVGEHGVVDTAMMHCTPGHDRREAAALACRLGQLEAIDPFSPRRAAACRASVMSAQDVGGLERYARSMHGQRLRSHGYGAPLVLYLWRDSRIEAGVTLLRECDDAPFDAAAVRLARRIQPLLQHAFGFAAEPPAPALDAGALTVGLTVREAEVARLVTGGASNAAIASSLTVSEATVKSHLTRIYAKLGVRSRTQLAVVMGDAG
jgi:DNA-binding CsgD family transcriptional regulator